LTSEVAHVPAGEADAVRAGLESYARYNTVLRLADGTRTDPQLRGTLTVRLLDCDDQQAVQAAHPLAPQLPELRCTSSGSYALATGGRFCITIANTSQHTLHMTVLNCTAGGAVEYLGDASIKAADTQTIWRGGTLRRPFRVKPDDPRGSTDRLMVVATTRSGTDLGGLRVEQTVQQVMEQVMRREQASHDRGALADEEESTRDLWTAAQIPLRIEPS
jgi:hypothetical protein